MNHAVIIIPVELKATANALVIQYFGGSGENFSIGLNATGNSDDPITHLWCAPRMTPENWLIVQELLAQFPDAVVERYDLDTNPSFPDTLLAQHGLKRIILPL